MPEHELTARRSRMIARLKAKGYRMTPQRLAILESLLRSTDHPSVERIHTELSPRFPNMSLATVYKTIAVLKQEGEVLEIGFSERNNRYDAHKPYPHPHLICTSCGEIMDPRDFDLQEALQRLTQETGYRITSHRLDFFGLCPRCQKKAEDEGKAKTKNDSPRMDADGRG